MKKTFFVLFMLVISVNIAFANEVDIKKIIEAAHKGNVNAQFYLGMIYAEGVLGMPKDSLKAVEWLEAAATQGFAKAQHNLGLMYLFGYDAIKKDSDKGLEYMKRAEAQGILFDLYNPKFKW